MDAVGDAVEDEAEAAEVMVEKAFAIVIPVIANSTNGKEIDRRGMIGVVIVGGDMMSWVPAKDTIEMMDMVRLTRIG